MHQNLRNGAAIVTIDGQQLGTVKEVRGAYFKVDAPMKPDYWLSCDVVAGEAVAGDATEGVRVNFAKEYLDANKFPEPATV